MERGLLSCYIYIPTSGLSDVMGMIEDTVFRNMVRDNRTVTPEIKVPSVPAPPPPEHHLLCSCVLGVYKKSLTWSAGYEGIRKVTKNSSMYGT